MHCIIIRLSGIHLADILNARHLAATPKCIAWVGVVELVDSESFNPGLGNAQHISPEVTMASSKVCQHTTILARWAARVLIVISNRDVFAKDFPPKSTKTGQELLVAECSFINQKVIRDLCYCDLV